MGNEKVALGGQRSSVPIIAYTLLGLIFLVAVGMPLIQSHYTYPRFIKLIIKATESEAIRTGRHMIRTLLQDYTGGELSISKAGWAYLDQTREDYNLWKVKLFSASGATIYSSNQKDIGKRNTHDYFRDVVAKGLVFTKIVQKDSKSLEGQIVSNDVVETYIPILNKGDFVGAFELYYNISVRKASMDAIVAQTNLLLYGLAGIIVLVVCGAAFGLQRGVRIRRRYEKALYTSATQDALTGVYNRRRFIELLEWEVEKSTRYQKSASLLMFDIDHFKSVNDTYGHQSGDDVLVAVAQACREAIRASDILARYGGEEFVVFLPETVRGGAVQVAEKIRQAVASVAVPTEDGAIRVTVSVGVADLSELDSISLDTAIQLADECLYRAKDCGRNRVCTSAALN